MDCAQFIPICRSVQTGEKVGETVSHRFHDPQVGTSLEAADELDQPRVEALGVVEVAGVSCTLHAPGYVVYGWQA